MTTVSRVSSSLLVCFLVFLCSSVLQANALSCQPCTAKVCGPRPRCAHSLVPGLCGCCWACAQQAGDSCGGYWNMLGVCEEGLNCLPDGLGRVFMRRFKGGPAFQKEIVFPRGVCRGESPKSPCDGYECPMGSRCELSWDYCSPQPENKSHSCQPASSCVALLTVSPAASTQCVDRHFEGCNILSGQCWCGTGTTCSTNTSFQYPSQGECKRALVQLSRQPAKHGAGPPTKANLTALESTPQQECAHVQCLDAAVRKEACELKPGHRLGLLHKATLKDGDCCDLFVCSQPNLTVHGEQFSKDTSTQPVTSAGAGKTPVSVVEDNKNITSSWLIAVVVLVVLAMFGFLVAVVCRHRNRQQPDQPKHAYIYSCIPANRPRTNNSIIRVGEQTPSGGMAHVQRLLDGASDSSSYTKQ